MASQILNREAITGYYSYWLAWGRNVSTLPVSCYIHSTQVLLRSAHLVCETIVGGGGREAESSHSE